MPLLGPNASAHQGNRTPEADLSLHEEIDAIVLVAQRSPECQSYLVLCEHSKCQPLAAGPVFTSKDLKATSAYSFSSTIRYDKKLLEIDLVFVYAIEAVRNDSVPFRE